MMNIEKYPNTKDALEAYTNEDIQRVPFDIWLDCESEEPREPTLLEAAENVSRLWFNDDDRRCHYDDLKKWMASLEKAIAREKQQPVRNIDRFATAEEACEVFNRMCEHSDCDSCKYNRRYTVSKCIVAWLYAEADEAGKEAK